MPDCLFCKIASHQIPVTNVYEDEWIMAFNDISPQAPTHILVIPKEHYAAAHELPPGKTDIMKKIFEAISAIVRQKGLAEKGYRVVINAGETAGQTVLHIHAHLLGGRDMRWPPG
jgi:histidine triad (HIT) family protein